MTNELKRIAESLEMIALFLQVLAEDQADHEDGSATTAHVVETQSGPVELR